MALNGTGTTWQLVLSEAQQTGQVPTSGNVTNAAAGSAQNEVWVQAFYSAGNFSFLAYDWEEKPGGFQTVTTYTFPSNVEAPPLQFFEVYVYAQPLQTVVSIVNTTNGAVIGSTPAMHPVLDQNLTKIGYLGDTLTAAASSVDSAMILDSAFFVDHNTYANAPGASTAAIPMVAGSVSIPDAAPFDPASVTTHWLNPPNSQNSYSSLTGSLSDFPSVVNSSSPASETSSLINATAILNSTTTASEADAPHTLATFRATPEDQTDAVSSTVYATTWTPQTIQSQIHSFLTNYISANTGVPAADIEIPGMLVSNIAVWTQFSSQAASTIHDYLASAIPGVPSVEQPRAGQPDHGSDRRRAPTSASSWTSPRGRSTRVRPAASGRSSTRSTTSGMRTLRRRASRPCRESARPERSSFPDRPRSSDGPRTASPSSASVVVSSSVSARRSPAPPPPSRASSVRRRAR